MAESMTCDPISQPAGQDLVFLLCCPEQELDRVLRSWSRPRMEGVLRLLGNRLGTPNEQPADFELVLRVAHQLNNLLTAERLLKEMAELDQEKLFD